MRAFNATFRKTQSDSASAKAAWAAVRNGWHKVGDKWVRSQRK
ncbi:MAG: ChaB family protein [Candidatus Hermodarchaeia archaeon]